MEDALKLDIKGIKCDNCDYKNPDVEFEDYEEWLNKPCPKCGANLLTQEDLDTAKAIIEIVKAFNGVLPKVEDNVERVTTAIEMNGTGDIKLKNI